MRCKLVMWWYQSPGAMLVSSGVALVEVPIQWGKTTCFLTSQKKRDCGNSMFKFSHLFAVAALLLLCAPAHSQDLDVDGIENLDPQAQMELLETQIAQISVSEKDIQDIIMLQEGGDALTEEEKQHLEKLEALKKRQETGMLTDADFNFPLELMKQHTHTKCNAQIIQAILSIVGTAKKQVRFFLFRDCAVIHFFSLKSRIF